MKIERTSVKYQDFRILVYANKFITLSVLAHDSQSAPPSKTIRVHGQQQQQSVLHSIPLLAPGRIASRTPLPRGYDHARSRTTSAKFWLPKRDRCVFRVRIVLLVHYQDFGTEWTDRRRHKQQQGEGREEQGEEDRPIRMNHIIRRIVSRSQRITHVPCPAELSDPCRAFSFRVLSHLYVCTRPSFAGRW